MRCRKILLCLFLGLIPLKLINSQENENTYSILEKSMQSNNWYWGQQKQSWLIDIIKENKNKSDDEKLKIINNFYNNQVRYGSDINIWEKVDYWATPFESLNQGGGDCEDYAIGKYFSLKKMVVLLVRNHDSVSIAEVVDEMQKSKVSPNIVVDCSHGNSHKNHKLQPVVFKDVMNQVIAGNKNIKGVMIESNIHEGSQKLVPGKKEDLKFGVSITDACIGWEETEEVIKQIAKII